MEKLNLSTHFLRFVPVALAGIFVFFKKVSREKKVYLGDNFPPVFF